MTLDHTAFFLALEREVWDALVRGDVAVDRAALADHFLGVYPTGFAGAHEHVAQLAGGPTVADYLLTDARTLVVADGHVMLAYLATYRRPGSEDREQMYVSSLWSRLDGNWKNVFSQDTPVGEPVP